MMKWNLGSITANAGGWSERLALWQSRPSKGWKDLGIRRWSFVLTIMGFLLGRAMILQELFPFAI